MRYGLSLLAAGFLGLLGASLMGAPSALACSAGSDFDPIAASDVIVAGRITGWRLLLDRPPSSDKTQPTPGGDPRYEGPYDPIAVDMTVDRVYKGSAPATIEMVSGSTLEAESPAGPFHWIGAGGACGPFDADPTGMYAILGLSTNDGLYSPNRLLVFFLGPQPQGAQYDVALQRLAALAPGALPLGGGPPFADEGRGQTGVLLTAGAAAAVLLAASAFGFDIRRCAGAA